MTNVLLDAAGVADHRQRSPRSTLAVRLVTRDVAIRPIRPRSKRSSLSCGKPATLPTACGRAV